MIRTASGWSAVALLALSFAAATPPASAGHTPDPSAVTVVGSLQSELGCAGDWQPDCAASSLTYESLDDVWQGVWTLPSGNWEFKAALNNGWTENYGANAVSNGANIAFSLAASTAVKFYYDHDTHWVTSSASSIIVTAPGSYQSELGCAADWDPSCLLAWLQDPDGDGIYAYSTAGIPVGAYDVKAAINESWNENYGAGGAANGANISFSVPNAGDLVTFVYDPRNTLLTVRVGEVTGVPEPSSLLLAVIGLLALGGLSVSARGARTPLNRLRRPR